MILAVGLGNPGKKYQNTRHNVGSMIVEGLEKEKLSDFVLAEPKTFMNESGGAVKRLIKKYRLNNGAIKLASSLLIIHDDIDIPLGQFKIQKGRGAAGHK